MCSLLLFPKSSMLHPVRGSGLMRCLSWAHESAAPEMHLAWDLWVLGDTGTLCHSPFQGPYSTTPFRNCSQVSVTLKIQMLGLFCLFLYYKVCILTPRCLLKPLFSAALSNVWGGRRSILCSPYRQCLELWLTQRCCFTNLLNRILKTFSKVDPPFYEILASFIAIDIAFIAFQTRKHIWYLDRWGIKSTSSHQIQQKQQGWSSSLKMFLTLNFTAGTPKGEQQLQ